MLIIEKVIKLLDDFHFNAFREHLKNLSKRSYYPLALIDVIDRDLMSSKESDYFCHAVYSLNDEKTRKKFFQLAHYTFKLTSYLSKNHPKYLQRNLCKIQKLINSGELIEANFLADILFEIANKIEDYHTELQLLEMQAQQNYLLESAFFSTKQLERVSQILDIKKEETEVFNHIFQTFNPKNKLHREDLPKHLEFFSSHFDSPSTALRLICRYYYQYCFFFFKDERFFQKSNFLELEKLEAKFQKNDFIIFPYLNDFEHNIAFLKLKHALHHEKEQEATLKLIAQMTAHGDNLLYWKSFVNLPYLNSIVLQADFYVKKYIHGPNSRNLNNLAPDVQNNIYILRRNCEELLENEILQQMFTIQYIRLTTTYALLLSIGDKEEQEKAALLLENLLLSYQQISFHSYLDPIYSILAICNFKLKRYERVEEVYKRYKRVFKNRVLNLENDLIIQAYYYASKWLETGRNQYKLKLGNVGMETERNNLPRAIQIIRDLSIISEIPTE